MAMWSTPVREYMSKGLVTVKPDTPLEEVHALVAQRDISALPVVDGQGALLGIVSTSDLLRKNADGKAEIVSDTMTAKVATIDEGASLREAAERMRERQIHRLVVTRRGRPVAIHSSRDAMRAVFFHHVELPLREVMSTPIETIEMGSSVQEAIVRLDVANVHGLVVVDQDWPVGVFTHFEALRALAAGSEALSAPVENAMSYETICLDASTPLYRAAGHAVQMSLRRILVVEHRRLRGIVSGYDLMRVMLRDDV